MDSLYRKNSVADFLITNFKWIVIAGIAIAIFMWYKGCGNKSVVADHNYKKEYDSVLVIIKKSEENRDDAIVHAMQQKERADSLSKKLLKSSDKLDEYASMITRLSQRVKQAVNENAVTPVSEPCDSLADISLKNQAEIDYYKNLSKHEREAKEKEVSFLSLALKESDEALNICKKTLDYGVNTVIPTIKRKAELYGGVMIYGNKSRPFFGFTGDVGLLTRKGAMIIAGYGLLNKGQYYNIGYLGRLSFKKH